MSALNAVEGIINVVAGGLYCSLDLRVAVSRFGRILARVGNFSILI